MTASRYPKLIFLRDYNHRWSNRAATLYPKGWEGRVKPEVAEAALGKRAAILAPVRAKADSDGQIPGRSGDMGGGDNRSPEPRRARRIRGRNSGDVPVSGGSVAGDRLEGDA